MAAWLVAALGAELTDTAPARGELEALALRIATDALLHIGSGALPPAPPSRAPRARRRSISTRSESRSLSPSPCISHLASCVLRVCARPSVSAAVVSPPYNVDAALYAYFIFSLLAWLSLPLQLQRRSSTWLLCWTETRTCSSCLRSAATLRAARAPRISPSWARPLLFGGALVRREM